MGNVGLVLIGTQSLGLIFSLVSTHHLANISYYIDSTHNAINLNPQHVALGCTLGLKNS